MLTIDRVYQLAFLMTNWELRFYLNMMHVKNPSKKQQAILDQIHSKLPKNIVADIKPREDV